jgi:hypothetical protein
LIAFSLNFAFAQSNFSESFFYFPKNIHLYVPSSACLDNNLQSNFGYKTYIGKLSIINTSYADLNVNVKRKRGKTSDNRHILGLGFYNDREGDFFNKTRVMARYAIHLPLREDLYLSVGSAFHLINYSFHASGSGTSGSAINWAGSLSSTLHAPSFNVSLSLNDFNNPQIRPINYNFNIYRYITLYGEKSFDLNENTQIKGAGRGNLIIGSTSTYLFQLGFVLSKIVGVNGFYYVDKGWGLAFDINKIRLYKSQLNFSLAYMLPKQTAYPAANQYELNLSYCIPQNK